jgi:uroporphyrinogen-III synthase/uroporphyrinogen III methyltransferase/synthase
MISQRLSNKRILVTRAAHQAGKLSDGLRALGAEPVEVPVLEIQPPASYAPLDAALRRLNEYDWLILTSANTVHVIAERAASFGVVFAERSPNVAAVGKATADAAHEAGMVVSLTPREYVAESLVDELLSQGQIGSSPPGKGTGFSPYVSESDKNQEGASVPEVPRILLVRATVARDVIPDALRWAGATVDVVDAYQNAIPTAAPDQLRKALAVGIDAATFTSSSSVTHLADVAHAAGIAFPFPNMPGISIGPITSQTLRDLNWPPAAEADRHDIPGLIAAVEEHFLGLSS